MTGKNIEATSIYFQDFEGKFSKKYFIPTLQRPYVWESKKHVKKFLDDILENEKGYFIGSIVVASSKIGTTGREEILDGQQRLTTIAISLIVIRDIIEEEKKEKVYEIILREIDSLLRFIDSFDNTEIIRLEFSDELTNNFYKSLVNKTDFIINTETQRRMKDNYNYLLKELQEEFNKGNIKDVFEKIKTLHVIGITCKNHDIAFELFESINATGLGLASVDLIKNFIFKNLKDDKEEFDSVEKKWIEMENIFSNNRNLFKTFLRHQWISGGEYVSHSALFLKVEGKFKNKKEDIVIYVDELLDDAKIYFSLREFNIDGLKKVNSMKEFEIKNLKELLRFLSFLGVDQVYAPILYFYKRKNINDFSKYLNKLIAFQFLYKYIPGSPSAAERIYAWMSELKGKENENFQKLIKLVEKSDNIFIEKFSEKAFYRSGKTADVQFVLERFIYSRGGAKAFREPTIEHIISQKDNDKERIIHKIGNLTIFERSVNSSLPEDFNSKIAFYKKSTYIEHHEIVDNYNFTKNYENAINDRTEVIAKELYNIFMNILRTGKIDKN